MGAYHYSSVYGAQSTNDSSAKKIKNKKVFFPHFSHLLIKHNEG